MPELKFFRAPQTKIFRLRREIFNENHSESRPREIRPSLRSAAFFVVGSRALPIAAPHSVLHMLNIFPSMPSPSASIDQSGEGVQPGHRGVATAIAADRHYGFGAVAAHCATSECEFRRSMNESINESMRCGVRSSLRGAYLLLHFFIHHRFTRLANK